MVGHPFITVAGRYHLRHLQNLGFKTYNGLIDESYDQESLDHVRYSKAMLQAMRLAWLENPAEMYRSLQSMLDRNYERLYSLQLQYRWEMIEMIHKNIPGNHFLWE